ncbi:uncharacterized protein LOC128235358 [Mya arenaria]|uniref:uncharacterized protein LOC128235358 n=1 Tax=Mya arenaria TaxID=6604 RepID=UPI0022E29151|nr:uncharacterized protein LOC128235358 [Mya arenaria]
MRFLKYGILCGLICLGLAAEQCIDNKGKNKCQKATSSADCDTENTGKQCMELRKGLSQNTFTICGGPQAEGCACDPVLTSSEACAKGFSCQVLQCHPNNGICKYTCQTEETFGIDCAVERPWRQVYHHDRYGVPLNGNIQDLIDAVKRGDDIKVKNIDPDGGLQTVSKVTVNKELNDTNVYAQSPFVILLTIGASTEAGEQLSIISTDGIRHLSTFPIMTDVPFPSRNNVDQARFAIWFIRSVYTQESNKEQVSSAVKDGGSVRVGIDVASAVSQYLPLETITEDLSGMTMHELKDMWNGRAMNTTEQRNFRSFEQNATGSTMEIASYQVNTPTLLEYKMEANPDLTWFVDPCWEMIYRNDAQGHALFGTRAALKQKVMEGHAVTVRIDGVFYKANPITITGDIVKITIYDSLGSDLENAEWNWIIVYSNGLVTTVKEPVGYGPENEETVVPKEVAWFSDIRDYNDPIVLANDGSGNKADIINAIEAGKDLRYMITMGNGDIKVYQPDAAKSSGQMSHSRELVNVDGGGNDLSRRYSVMTLTGVYQYRDLSVVSRNLGDLMTINVVSTWFIGN